MRPHEKRRAERRFDFMQRLARARLRERELLRRAEQRAALLQRDQEAQLLDVHAREDRVERGCHRRTLG
jgi:hypothetical protein